MATPPRIVGIGGTTRSGSSTEKALRYVANEVERLGGIMQVFAGPQLIIPPYLIDQPERSAGAREIIEALRDCDGVVLASPGYHGSFSGLLKNVIDYAEDLAHDQRPYLAGRVVGCIATGLGWQAIGTTLASLRSVVHALGAWPTPMGVAMNTAAKVFDENNRVLVPEVAKELDTLAAQLVEFSRMRKLYLESTSDIT